MTTEAGTAIHDAILSFSAAPDSIHEQLSLVDFLCRVAFAISAPAALLHPSFKLATPTNPGIGAFREALASMSSCLLPVLQPVPTAIRTLLGTPLPASDPKLQSIENLRNHLFHGGSAPESRSSVTIAATIAAAAKLAGEAIVGALSSATLETKVAAVGPLRLTMVLGGTSWQLSPFLAISPRTNALLVFSRVTTASVALNAAKHEGRHIIPRSDYEPELRRVFRMDPSAWLASDLAQAAIEDVEGFQEPGTTIRYHHEATGVVLEWVHADGAVAVPRRDHLRVGPDNAWQWKDADAWVGYTTLLKRLANWTTLTARMGRLLGERVAKTAAAEHATAPTAGNLDAPFIPTTIRVGQIGASSDALSLDQFRQRLDADVQSDRGTTCLYFIHAEAGAGKTTTLLRLAVQRADELSSSDSLRPLLLYVSARGNVLEDLDKAIDATVAETRVITSGGVRALCRNGLVVPIVDGFDELVGSPTYSDALASLRPWLQALGGRGVLVVSARSSYFVSLYEDSIRRETNRDINVWHYIAQLDRWTSDQRDDYLKQCGVDPSLLMGLPVAERELLRLPFFARASIGPLSDVSQPPADLVESLIRSYIEREQAKIAGPTGALLVDAGELGRLFEELAHWMMMSSTREVAWEDFRFIAEALLTGGTTDELRNRMAALCGLDVQGGRDRRFRFSHEMFQDFFFGRYVGRVLSGASVVERAKVLTSARLTTGAARTAWRVCKPVEKELAELAPRQIEPNPRSDSPLASNVGLLWSELVGATHALRSVGIVGVQFAELDLRAVELDSVTFSGCTFKSLVVGGSQARNVEFANCSVGDLRLQDGSGFCFTNCSIDAAASRLEFGDEASEIASLLRRAGAVVTLTEHPKTGADAGLAKSARFFLEKIVSRVAMSIVLSLDTHLPQEDPSLGWIERKAGDWLVFLRLLGDHKLVTLEKINAGGRPKVRVSFLVPPGEILRSDGSVPSIASFWRAIAAVS